MLNIEVMVASMGQKDFSLCQKMNINTDVVIANQSDRFIYREERFGSFTAKMITTATKGVGLNRNIGLQYATGDILIFSDDDIIYYDGYENIIAKAFDELPDADVIIFGMRYLKNGEVYTVDKYRTQKLHFWNGLRFGTFQIAVRSISMLKANLHFSHLFGGGCIYSAGEDSLFLMDCFRHKLNLYTYAAVIGDNTEGSSTWFHGYTEKFFHDRGVLAAALFPRLSGCMCLYYLFVYRKQRDIKNIRKYQLMKSGVKEFRKR